MKKTLTLSLLAILSCISQLKAEISMQNVLDRDRISLNGEWDILLDLFSNGTKAKWWILKDSTKNKLAEVHYEGDMTLNVPGDWNHQDPQLCYYEGDIWYKRVFTFKPTEDGKRHFLHFGAVSTHCDVYLNGEHLGGHKGGFTPFQFEVGDKLKDGENYLIVRVDNMRSKTTIPALNFDWWNYGGITRDVDIISVPESYINDYKVCLKDNKSDQLFVEVQLDGANIASKKVTIAIPEAKIKLNLTTDSNGYASVTKKAKLKLWSPESPNMYSVQINSESDSVEDLIGFRTIEVRGEDIILNGEPLFLRGINIHEEIASQRRRSFGTEDAEALISQAEALGCNFIRLAHYPQNEYMVRLAEQRGFLMWEEIPVWMDICFEDEQVCEEAHYMMTEMIERDKNRCGIILWSINNETYHTSDARNSFLAKLAKYTKETDPTRLVTSALNKAKAIKEGDKHYMVLPDPLIEHLDVVGINMYVGWYMMFPTAPEELNWRIATGKPLIMSEFGAECVAGNNEGDTSNLNSWSEDYMSQVYRDNIASFANFPNLRGTAPWILYDFRSPRRPHAKFQQGWNRKGLISPEGQRKQAWYVMRDYYETKK